MPAVFSTLLFGLFILLISTEIFLKMAVRVSLLLKISPLIVGATVVAIGTSLPELTVSFLSLKIGDTGLAVGNIIGSNIINIFLIFSLSILMGRLKMGTTKTQRNAITLLLATFAFFVFYKIIPGSYFFGLIFVFLGLIFTFFEYVWGIKGSKHEDKKFIAKKSYKIGKGGIFLLLLSVLGIFTGGSLTVSSFEKISIISGISTTVLGLSLAAVATSLPELFFTIICFYKGEQKMATGNILGSNIYNILFVGGMTMFFPKKVDIADTSWFMFILSMILLVITVFYYRGKLVSRKVGLLLFFFFPLYIYLLNLAR